MNIKFLIGLIITTLIAAIIDCYSGYVIFFMTAMPMGHYLSPLLLVAIVILAPVIFIVSIINLYRFKKWAYYIFFIFSLLMHLFLIEEDIYFYFRIKRIGIEQLVPVISLTLLIIYFMLPRVRKLFK